MSHDSSIFHALHEGMDSLTERVQDFALDTAERVQEMMTDPDSRARPN